MYSGRWSYPAGYALSRVIGIQNCSNVVVQVHQIIEVWLPFIIGISLPELVLRTVKSIFPMLQLGVPMHVICTVVIGCIAGDIAKLCYDGYCHLNGIDPAPVIVSPYPNIRFILFVAGLLWNQSAWIAPFVHRIIVDQPKCTQYPHLFQESIRWCCCYCDCCTPPVTRRVGNHDDISTDLTSTLIRIH